jgi:CDP-glycerol glycerophosphotransferase
VDWPAAPAGPRTIDIEGAMPGLSLIRTRAGNFGVHRYTSSVLILGLLIKRSSLELQVERLGGAVVTAARLEGGGHAVDGDVRWDRSGSHQSITIPLTSTRWSRTSVLPSGTYDLTILDGDVALQVVVTDGVLKELPLVGSGVDDVQIRIERSPTTRNLKIITTALPRDQIGRYHRAQQLAIYRAKTPPLKENAVLFRSFYGENTSDNGRAIHREIERRGLPLELYWAVRDPSIEPPDGGIPVIAGSDKWYELLASSKYLVDNVHQPDFFVKRPGQVFVQTMHGYPFKRTGASFWEDGGYSPARIKSFTDRQQDWDFFISPAPYATPLLQRDFVSSAKMLEIGYPRNDVFFSDEMGELRRRSRDSLGLDEEAIAVLYAPTFRESLAVDEFHAKIVDFLNYYQAIKGLPRNFVILVRGHAMNARAGSRARNLPERVIDVTDYPLIEDLCLASDAGVFDYSSLRFDYALTGKPMIFLAPDLESYRDEQRGWMLPYEETAPGPVVRSTDEVVDCLRNLDVIEGRYASARNKFIATYMPLEDGAASSRLVDAVFV